MQLVFHKLTSVQFNINTKVKNYYNKYKYKNVDNNIRDT